MFLKRLPITIFLLGLLTLSCFSQQKTPLIDSLQKLIPHASSEKEQVDLYNQIAFQLLYIDTLGAMSYKDSASMVSKEIDYGAGYARALNIEAIHHIFQSRYHQGIEISKNALSFCEESDHRAKGKLYNAIGMAYQRMYIVDKSLEHYQHALEHATLDADTLTCAVVLGNIANMQRSQNNDEEARKYFLQLEKISSNHKDQNVQFAFNIRYAEFLIGTEEFERSYIYLKRALKNAEILKHNSKIRKVRLQMGISAINAGNYELAEINIEAILRPEFSPEEITWIRYHFWTSELEKNRRNYNKAIRHAQICLEKIDEQQDFYFYKPKALKILHRAYSQTGNHKKAYQYLSELSIWQDSLDLKERENKFIELDTKYQSEKKEIENALLLEQSDGKSVKLKQRTTLVWLSLFALVLSFILFYNLFRNWRKDRLNNELLESKVLERTKELQKSNEELERFAYIASHDLKEPLKTIKGFTNLLKTKLELTKDYEETKTYFEVVEKSTDQMYYLVDGILDYSKLDDKVKKEQVDLNEILEKVKSYLHHLISQRRTRIISNELPTIHCNSIQIFQVFKNLIENGIKYNESEERIIEIEFTALEEHIQLRFKDNGIGIDEKYQDQIFEMFSRLHNQEKYVGSGLGLSIVKKIIVSLGGTLNLKGSNENGSVFCVMLPN